MSSSSTTKPSTDIFLAVVNDDLVAFKDFVETKKVPLTSTTGGKRTAAHIAAKHNRLEIFKYIANANAKLINSEDMYGYTPLFTAVERGALEVVQYLVGECKVRTDQHNKRLYGNTPVHLAAKEGHLEVLRYLVKGDAENKVDVNAKNELGEPPCFLAAEGGHLPVIKFLAEETNADFTLVDSKKDNILFVCAAQGHVDIAKYLWDERKMEFDVNKRDGLGRTLAFLAAGSSSVNFLKYLVAEKGANVNCRDRLGRTPLHQAASAADIQTVKYLLERGADPKIEDFNGKSPSKSTSDRNMKKYLEKMEGKAHRRRRNANVVFEDAIQPSKGSSMLYEWLQDTIVADRLVLKSSESPIDHYREHPLHDHVTSSQVNGFLALLGVWVRWATKRSKLERQRHLSQSPLNRMDSLSPLTALEKFHVT